MRTRFGLLRACAIVAAAAVPAAALAAPPSISGNYILVKRVMADGKTMTPPAVVGMMNFTNGYRNFNVAWKGPDGTPMSLSMLAKYTLTATEYCQTPLAWVANNVPPTPGLVTEAPKAASGCTAVKTDHGKMTVALGGEPVVATFDAKGMKAENKGVFTDYWEKMR